MTERMGAPPSSEEASKQPNHGHGAENTGKDLSLAPAEITADTSSTGDGSEESLHLSDDQGIDQTIKSPSREQDSLAVDATVTAKNRLGEGSPLPEGQVNRTERMGNQEEHVTRHASPIEHGVEEGLHFPGGQGNGHDDATSDAGSDDGMFVKQVKVSELVEDDIKREDMSDAGDLNQDRQDRTEDQNQPEHRDQSGYQHHPEHQTQPEQRVEPEYQGQSERRERPEDDDDDECMIIDGKDVPDGIMAIFSSFEYGKSGDNAADVICTGSVRVKIEEQDNGDRRDSSEPSGDDDSHSVFQGNEDVDLSDGERPKKRSRLSSKRQGKPKAKQVEMDHGNEGSADQQNRREWREPTDEELMHLYTRQEELIALKAKGQLPLAKRVALARITAKLATIEKMAGQLPNEFRDPMELLDNGQDEDRDVEEQVSQVLAHFNARITPPLADDIAGAVDQNLGPASGINNQNKSRRPPPKTAKEYWERKYAENGSAHGNKADKEGKRKRSAQSKRKNTKKGAARESRLMRMLQDSNPIAARAAQGAMTMPGPIQAKKQDDQLKAMKAFLFKISSNPNARSRSLDLRVLREALKSFGSRQVLARNGMWKLKGMISNLYNHQLVGVRWMFGQEFSPDGPYGGILGDQMGLGKTVQVLAAMSANRPSPQDVEAGCHQTLIVAPAVAITQRDKEIEKHCDKSFIKLVHHYKASQKLRPGIWKSADIM